MLRVIPTPQTPGRHTMVHRAFCWEVCKRFSEQYWFSFPNWRRFVSCNVCLHEGGRQPPLASLAMKLFLRSASRIGCITWWLPGSVWKPDGSWHEPWLFSFQMQRSWGQIFVLKKKKKQKQKTPQFTLLRNGNNHSTL